MLILAPGQVNDTGLHLLAFDNDDLYLSDGLGRLVYQRVTDPDGTLSLREGSAHGCACALQISPEGRRSLESAPTPELP